MLRKSFMALAAVVALVSPLLVATPVNAKPAQIEVPTLVFSSYGNGYNRVINGQGAFAINLRNEIGQTVTVFSLDPGPDYADAPANKYHPTMRSDVPSALASWIAVNSASVPSPLSDINAEYTAIQLAIWKVSKDLNYSSVRNSSIRNRADALVSAAQSLPYSTAMYAISYNWTAKGKLVARVTGDAVPVSGVKVDLSNVSTRKHMTVKKTGAYGKVQFNKTPVDSFLTARLALPAGTVLVPSGGGARVVTTAEVYAPTSIQAVKPRKFR